MGGGGGFFDRDPFFNMGGGFGMNMGRMMDMNIGGGGGTGQSISKTTIIK